METVTEDLQFFSPRRDVGRFFDPRFPGTVRNRMWNRRALKDVLARVVHFQPDAIVADGSMVGGAALQIRNHWNRPIPLLVRSHNVEFEHCRMLGRHESNPVSRLAYGIEATRYRWFEERLLKRADHVFHSSHDDFQFWQSANYANQSWLPPIILPPEKKPASAGKPFDVVYLGNLGSSHKLASILWFVREVRPLLPASLRIAIGGADAPALFAAVCREQHCEYMGKVKIADEFLVQGRILVNPVSDSCGLNIKMAEMLDARVPIVSTSAGIRGYPGEIQRWVHVANTPEEFAAAIRLALEESPPDDSATRWLRDTFGPQTLDIFLSRTEEILRAFARKAS